MSRVTIEYEKSQYNSEFLYVILSQFSLNFFKIE